MNNLILNRAISLGFQGWDPHGAREYIDSHVVVADERYECVVTGDGLRQHVSFDDYHCDGQIVDFAAHWHDEPGTEVTHSRFVNVDGKVVELYYVVPQTEYNTPLTIFVD